MPYRNYVLKLLLEGGCSFVKKSAGGWDIWTAPDGRIFMVDTSITSHYNAELTLKNAGIKFKFNQPIKNHS
jgi:hypothetical protein